MPVKVRLVKALFFPVMYGCENWTIKGNPPAPAPNHHKDHEHFVYFLKPLSDLLRNLFHASESLRSDQSLSRVRLFSTPWIAAHQASLSIINSWSPPKPTSIESVMPSNHLILCRPLLLLPSIFPSIKVFSSESALHTRWPKYWSFSFNISPPKEHRGLISFRMDWLDLLAVQGTLQESSPTPQFKSINSSALSFLYSPTLTSIDDHCKNHSLVWAIKKALNGMFSSVTNIKLQDLLGNYKISLV